ncbi:MAG: GTP 3',8-cyclase MoaA [Planctomycetota bacterium]
MSEKSDKIQNTDFCNTAQNHVFTATDCEGRYITHLRMSITSRCNLSCSYCHREGDFSSCESEEMSLPTIKSIIRSSALIGITHLKITGGEPLIREDLPETVAFAKSAGIRDVSLTTNGVLLAEKASQLRKAGLDRLNVGCDSISSSVSPKNTKAIFPGITAVREAGFEATKINMVVLRNINDSEIEKIIEFARDNKLILQLIELVPTEDKEYYSKYHVDLTQTEEYLNSITRNVRIRSLQGRKQFEIDNVVVETVRPFHEEFCRKCTKLRITSSGMIKPCLMVDTNLVKYSGVSSLLQAISYRRIYK